MSAPTTLSSPPSRPNVTQDLPATRAGVWWLSPVAVIVVMIPTIVLATALLSPQSFVEQWDSPKRITVGVCLLFLASGLAVAVGAAAVIGNRPLRPRPGRWPSLTPTELSLLRRAGVVLFVLTVIGYTAFVVLGARSGVSLAQLGSSINPEPGDEKIKRLLGTVAGVTTMTEFGIGSVAVSSLLIANSRRNADVARLLVVFALAVPRAFLLGERLAVLELLIPTIVVFAMHLSHRPRSRRLVALVPIVAVPVVAAVFATFEYFRSWVYVRNQTATPYVQWALERLLGYYATALNNGALQLTFDRYPGRWPNEILSFFWDAPIISDIGLYEMLSGRDYKENYKAILATYGNPEFINNSGLAGPIVDLGIPGGLLLLLCGGLLIGYLYRAFRESDMIGLILYPSLFTGLVELPRLMPWTTGRTVPVVVAAIVIVVLLRRRQAATTAT